MYFQKRKETRIPNYNYGSYNYYFVTICAHNKKCIFGQPNALNSVGKTAEQYLKNISKIYPQVIVDKFVVMPNHIHMILIMGKNISEKNLPDLTRVVGQFKMAVTKEVHKVRPDLVVWQRSFHDHIIRNQHSYEKIWNYIDGNPAKWEEDCFYITDSKL